jgi:dihydroorotate dehydrogenase
MLYLLARHLLFLLPPEASHHVSLAAISLAERLGLLRLLPPVPADPVEVMGLHFPNRVGLAAGLDKNGDHIDGLAALGFGFIEIGTVTPRPQPGNPRPRLFRLPEATAIINRMGFNNLGVDHLVRRVEACRYRGVLGINIGKNFDTPVERAVEDYLYCLERVYAHASYVTVNISSPNTRGLRSLQTGDAFAALLEAMKKRQGELAVQHGRHVPLLVKIAPDLGPEDVEAIASALCRFGIDGVIATNTTIGRAGVEHLPHGAESGGLSGAPVRAAATRVQKQLVQALAGKVPVIGVGGITDAASAVEKCDAGAELVQVYTGFIYRGPALLREVSAALAGRHRPGRDRAGA